MEGVQTNLTGLKLKFLKNFNQKAKMSKSSIVFEGIWQGMLHYLQKSKESNIKNLYRIKYSNEDDLGITFDSLVIEATSRLDAIIKLKEYLNEHEMYPYTLSCFQDDCFNDILYDYDDIDAQDMESIFENKNIGEIIDKFVNLQFNNKSFWLEHWLKLE
jgi:hypothetical protein